jgi:hypothetical protein
MKSIKGMTDTELGIYIAEQIDGAMSGWYARFISQDNKDLMAAEKKLFLANPDIVTKLNQLLKTP